jgi:hypothetical protein
MQTMQRGHYLRTIEGQFVGNLLRFETGLAGEKLLDSVRGTHGIPTVAQAGGCWELIGSREMLHG